MAFFRNTTVNLLNLHYAIRAIAQSGGGAFVAAYLLKAGVSVPGVLAALALMLVGRFLVRPVLINLTRGWGMRPMVIVGSVLSALQFPVVAEVHGIGLALAAYVVVTALGDALYWTAYHAYFAALGDHEHRGHQLGARQALAALIGIASPIASGWLLVAVGPRAAFDASALVCVLAIVPLFWAPNVAVERSVPGAYKAARFGAVLFAADGLIAAGNGFVWQVALFVSLGRSFLAYGGALAVAALAGALISLLLGRHIDLGHGRRAAWYTFGAVASIIALRAIATGNAPLAVAANALGALSGSLYVPTMLTAVYNEAKRSLCTMRFHAACESGWDVGSASGLLLAALLVILGAPLWSGILVALLGATISFLVLRHYYSNLQKPAPIIVPNAISNPGTLNE